ncbi:MAG: cation:proton antiporter [Candidatus Delongbacteria bacterium]|nr:cation:proton antiporter [Candidatus Delongbacteria bacterium]
MNHLSEHQVLIFLVQFALLLGLSRWLGLVFQRFNQPTITAEILVGVILGPTLLGRLVPGLYAWLFPEDPVSMIMIETVAWIGILFLLLETGLEVNFSRIWRQKGQAVKIAVSDIILPILISGAFIYWLPDHYLPDPGQRWMFTGFIATIMTISALPIAIRVMHDVNILKTDMGFLVISALTINDIIGWVIFALLLGSVSLHTTSIPVLIGLVAATVGYTFVTLKYVRKLLDRMIRQIKELYTENMAVAISLISVLGMISGAITLKIGIHALFGFFILGMAAGESSALSEKDRITISRMVYAIFVPVFFAGIGLKIDFIENFEVLPALLITLVGITARYGGAYIGSI